jgi:hypothetical protein
MRAEVLGMVGRFEVEPQNGVPPANLTLTLRRCWRRPPEQLEIRFLYQHEEIAYYAAVEKK